MVLYFRVVKLGGHKVRNNVSDAHDAAGVFSYRDSSIALLLDMRRRFKAVMDVLGAMIRYGVSLSFDGTGFLLLAFCILLLLAI